MRDNKKRNQIIVWLLTVAISVVYLYFGNKLAVKDLDMFGVDGAYAARAKVVSIENAETSSFEMSDETVFENTNQYFYAKGLNGQFKDEVLFAAQTSDNYLEGSTEKPVEPGDKVILYNYGTPQGEADWVFGGYARFDQVVWLIAVFFILLIVFGRVKGLNTIVSLGFTVLAVFAVFVPSVLSGFNIYLMTSVTCVFTIVMTLLITNGASQKSLTTILGCTFGVAVSALLEIVMDHAMKLTGIIDEHSIYLQYLSSGVELDLKALIFAMVVIGAMGAVMDVAMDISSSLAEIHLQAPHLKFMDLVKSGLRIGRDIMGTMANTLVLAYIGSSLCTVLLLITYSASLLELLNRESVAVELMQSMIGSLAILLTIPLTSIVCAALYTAVKKDGGHEGKALVKDDTPVIPDVIPDMSSAAYKNSPDESPFVYKGRNEN